LGAPFKKIERRRRKRGKIKIKARGKNVPT
jgi:hypothetical protein